MVNSLMAENLAPRVFFLYMYLMCCKGPVSLSFGLLKYIFKYGFTAFSDKLCYVAGL